jgi:hypothetical protein
VRCEVGQRLLLHARRRPVDLLRAHLETVWPDWSKFWHLGKFQTIFLQINIRFGYF